MWCRGNLPLLAVLLAFVLSSAQATGLIQALQDAGASQFAALIQSDPNASAVYFSSQVQTVFAPIDGATNSSISKLRRRQSSAAALQRKLYQSTSNTNTLGSMSSGSGLAMMSNEKSAKLGGKRQVFVSNPLNKTKSKVVKRWDDESTVKVPTTAFVMVPTTAFVTVPTTKLITLPTTVHDIDVTTVVTTVHDTELITLVTTVHDTELITLVTTMHDIDVTTVVTTVHDIDLTSVLTTVHDVDLITTSTTRLINVPTTDITTVHDTALITVTTTELISVPITMATTLFITVINTVQNTQFVTVPSTLLTTVVTTVLATVLTTVPSTLVTTVPTTLLTTVLNTVHNTELVTVPTTLLTTVLTTVQNTRFVTVPTTLLTAVPTTVLITVPTTVSTIVLTSVLTTVRTTVYTTVHTTVTTKVAPTAVPSLLQISSGLGNTVNIIQGDIPFNGGLIHIVDDYFTLPESLTNTANANGQTAFTGLASSYSLTDTFDNTQQITCFIPTNAAFAMPGSTSNYSSIQNLLLGHMIPNFVGYLPSLSNGTTYTSQSGTTFTVTIQGVDYYINNAKILTSNVIVENGVAHVIDQVIQPTKPAPTRAPSSASSLRGKSLQLVVVVWSFMLFLAAGGFFRRV